MLRGIGRCRARSVAAGVSAPTTNLVHHYKLNTGLTQAGGFASQWADQVGTGHLVQATGSKQPAVGGSGTLTFDGSSDSMTAAFTLNQPFTRYIRFRFVATMSDVYVMDGGTDESTVLYEQTATSLKAYAGALSSGETVASGTWYTVREVYNGASSVFQLDANAEITGNFGSNNAGGLTLGAVAGGHRNFSNIEVAEVLIYSVADDSTNATAVRAYMPTP